MDALSNHPPLADRLALDHERLKQEIALALAGLEPFTVESDAQALLAAEAVKPLKTLQGRVETTRTIEKAPLLAGERTVDDFFKKLRVDLDAMVAAFTTSVNAYQTKKREEARKIQAAKARVALAMFEPAPVAAAPAETARVATATGVAVSGSVRWDHEIEDASLLPRELLMPNDAAIKAKRDGLKAQGIKIEDAKIPGVRIFEKVGTTFR